jgi:diguanylate cyclase (GGDEF)-like protein
VRITTFLAETFADEVGAGSGAVTKSLVGTLGYISGLMMTTMVADANTLARRDALTGLENRLAWGETLEGYGGKATIGVIDLDGLKRINDTQGHEVGDAYIKKFAAELGAVIRDPVRAYRFGGDEFGILRQGECAAEISDLLGSMSKQQGVAPFSYGVAAGGEVSNSVVDLFELADSRMYEMKKGRKKQEGELSSNPTVVGA